MNQYSQKLQRSITEQPEAAMYILLCGVFKSSGANKTEITRLFREYMPKDDFDKEEQKELIDYLYKKAHE